MSIEKDIKGLQIIANQRCMCSPEQQSGEDASVCISCIASGALNEVAELLRDQIKFLNAEVDKQVEKDLDNHGIKRPTKPEGAYSDVDSKSTFMHFDEHDDPTLPSAAPQGTVDILKDGGE